MKHRRPTVKELRRLLAWWGKGRAKAESVSELLAWDICIAGIEVAMKGEKK